MASVLTGSEHGMAGGFIIRPEGIISCVTFAIVSILGKEFLFFCRARSLRVYMESGLVKLS